MIIILTPTKDTYVTNLQTELNDGSLANTGHAATLDLFKLYNENKYSKSWAAFKFTNALDDNSSMTLIDVDGNTVNFIVKTNTNTKDGSLNGNNVVIGVQSANNQNQAARFAEVINAVTSFNNGLTLNITAYSNSNNELILKQNKAGESGDTTFTLPTNMEHIGTDATGTAVTKFARIDYSAALLKFDIESFKTNYANALTIGSSVYKAKTIDFNNDGDFIDAGDKVGFKAELVLKDVTTGLSKPKDYVLTSYPLRKDFDEGIGKDTIHFSDKDNSNFVNLTNSVTWEAPGFISKSNSGNTSGDYLYIENNSYYSNSNSVEKGNEDVVFDVTSYVTAFLDGTVTSDKGFVVTFSEGDLYDQITYFVKRTGSRHLLNKKFIPQLRLIINDSYYHIPQNPKNKMRYLDNKEIFYLFNRVNGKLSSFSKPDGSTGNDELEFEIGSLKERVSTSDVNNFKGKTLVGIKKAEISNTDISRYNSLVSTSLLSNGFVKDTLQWYWVKVVTATDFEEGKLYKVKSADNTTFSNFGTVNNTVGKLFVAKVAGGVGAGDGTAYEMDLTSINTSDTSTVVTATDFKEGKLYKVKTAGDTDFSTFGTVNNTVGKLFVAKVPGNVGSGTGTAYEINIDNLKVTKSSILSEEVKFYAGETLKEINYRNVNTAIRIEDNDLIAEDNVQTVEVFFIDTFKQYDYVKVPYNLPSDNLGDVFYRIVDIDTNDVLIDYEEEHCGTKMFFDGEKYIFDLFVPKIFKNRRVVFEFKFKDNITGSSKKIKNKDKIFRIL